MLRLRCWRVSRTRRHSLSSFFFFNDTATTEIYTLSLHDALPICLWTRARFGASTAPRNHGRRWSARVAAPDVVHNARRLRGAATADETRPPGAKCHDARDAPRGRICDHVLGRDGNSRVSSWRLGVLRLRDGFIQRADEDSCVLAKEQRRVIPRDSNDLDPAEHMPIPPVGRSRVAVDVGDLGCPKEDCATRPRFGAVKRPRVPEAARQMKIAQRERNRVAACQMLLNLAHRHGATEHLAPSRQGLGDVMKLLAAN